jgi:hypothetical protein
MSGSRFGVDFDGSTDFSVYTVPLLRTAFYSGGAFFCLWFMKYESTALPTLGKAILALRR